MVVTLKSVGAKNSGKLEYTYDYTASQPNGTSLDVQVYEVPPPPGVPVSKGGIAQGPNIPASSNGPVTVSFTGVTGKKYRVIGQLTRGGALIRGTLSTSQGVVAP